MYRAMSPAVLEAEPAGALCDMNSKGRRWKTPPAQR